MIPIEIAHVTAVIQRNQKVIDLFVEKRKRSLKRIQKRYLTKRQVVYVEYLYKNLEKIIVARPDALTTLKGHFPKNCLKAKKRCKKSFKNKILDALDYDGFRATILPKYFQDIGIKSCVYCNSLLTISIKKEKSIKARFQVDHYWPKSTFPCFSISLFNLYPVCGPCNNAKSFALIPFDLYSLDKSATLKSKFLFKLKAGSVAKYLLSKNQEDIEFEFKEPNKPGGKKNPFEKQFGITGIYNTQKDIVEELIYKAEVYTPQYKKALLKNFDRIVSNTSISSRILIGNYVDENDLHKRPMVKFTIDIARQLKLIKS